MSRVVVIDTNMLYTDASMTRPASQALLDGARDDRYLLVVPRVVVEEATKQYGARLRKALKELNLSIGKQQQELTRLGEAVPERHEVPSRQAAEAAYSRRLQGRLSQDGVIIADNPDLQGAVNWYVRRRRPFKETGQGLADAVVWFDSPSICGRRPRGRSALREHSRLRRFS